MKGLILILTIFPSVVVAQIEDTPLYKSYNDIVSFVQSIGFTNNQKEDAVINDDDKIVDISYYAETEDGKMSVYFVKRGSAYIIDDFVISELKKGYYQRHYGYVIYKAKSNRAFANLPKEQSISHDGTLENTMYMGRVKNTYVITLNWSDYITLADKKPKQKQGEDIPIYTGTVINGRYYSNTGIIY